MFYLVRWVVKAMFFLRLFCNQDRVDTLKPSQYRREFLDRDRFFEKQRGHRINSFYSGDEPTEHSGKWDYSTEPLRTGMRRIYIYRRKPL